MKEQKEQQGNEKQYVILDTDGMVSNHRYQVVFVDEYNNWYLIGFFEKLSDAEPELKDYLEGYEFEEEGVTVDEVCHLEEYPSTFCTCFDKVIDTTCGCVEIRGFIY